MPSIPRSLVEFTFTSSAKPGWRTSFNTRFTRPVAFSRTRKSLLATNFMVVGWSRPAPESTTVTTFKLGSVMTWARTAVPAAASRSAVRTARPREGKRGSVMRDEPPSVGVASTSLPLSRTRVQNPGEDRIRGKVGRYILALDQGTTSSRAIVFGRDGRAVASAQQELPQIFPAPGEVEHDPEAIWSSQLAVAREALAGAGVAAADLAAIGLTNQRETTILW